jgi:hypothetical protein
VGAREKIVLNQLKIETEKAKLLPEFGVKYDHMFAFGNAIFLDGNDYNSMPWSSK